jgi:serine/threonine protein kinase
MPAPATAIDFLDVVRKSGLVPADRLNSLLTRLPTADAGNIDRLTEELVRVGLLTFFQAKQLKQGRYKRFLIAGKYRLLELLGVGGMGAVYLCEHRLMKRLVAVKVLPLDKSSSDQSLLERFYREARAVAALDHPNIVRAYDIDEADQVHFLVMEYVDGASLQELVAKSAARKQMFDPVRAAHYIAQAAAGLGHAAGLGLIHRDIKPGNLLLDRTGTVKVLDMGLARFFDHRHDGITQRFDDKCVLGTADYLAPEQVTGENVDVRADIYGLGGTLYFMLTGSSPFPDGTVAQKLVAHQTLKPRPVTDFRSDVPADLLRVLNGMTQKDPAERYQTPAEVIRALEPWTRQPIGPPAPAEMPQLSPAVLHLMGQNPLPGRGPVGGSSHHLFPLSDRIEALAPTSVSMDTNPIRLETAPATRPAPPSVRPGAERRYSLGTVVAVGVGSFLLGALLFGLPHLFR